MATVAFLGPEGTYTHQAALQQFPEAKFVPQKSISECFDAVHCGDVDYAVVPFENSTNGQVVYTYDLIRDWFIKGCNFKIVAEQFVSIHHNFITRATDLNDIEKVYSHPQVWGQVTKFLADKLPVSIRREDVSLTSKAAEDVYTDTTGKVAAISSQMAADRYNLPIMFPSIEDNPNNTTRFLVLGYKTPTSNEDSHDNKYITSLLFTLNHDDPGALCAALDTLHQLNVNMTSISSRPSHLEQWQYVFFVEIHGDLENDENVQTGVQELAKVCQLHVLGLFQRKGRS